MQYELINNEDARRYEYQLDGGVAVIEYIIAGEKIFLTHTEVPKKFEGQGIASALVKDVLGEVKESGRALIPLCPYVAMYIKRHPEWKELVMKNINIG